MADYFCDRCGDYLPEGSVRFRVHIHILSDFEEMFFCEEDPDDDISEHLCQDTPCFDDCGECEGASQELALVLCEDCKKKFAANPCNKGTGPFRLNRKVERLFH